MIYRGELNREEARDAYDFSSVIIVAPSLCRGHGDFAQNGELFLISNTKYLWTVLGIYFEISSDGSAVLLRFL